MLRGILAVAAVCGAAVAPANADVTSKAPDGFVIQIKGEVALDRDAAWARLTDVSSWWNSSHTYSGDSANLKLDAMAGGCWCELWSGGEVEHGRVVTVMPMSVIRIDGAFGPLQEMGVQGAMTFTLSDGASGGTALTLDYKVNGSSLSKLDGLADVVNSVLAEQVAAFTTPG